MTNKKKPCEDVKKGTRACYWQTSTELCTCYNPRALLKHDGVRYPHYSQASEVPEDFCANNWIPLIGESQHYNRNISSMTYEKLVKTGKLSGGNTKDKRKEKGGLF